MGLMDMRQKGLVLQVEDHEDEDEDEDEDDETTKKCCVDCNTSNTPLWRAGPAGPKSLCNACGIRFRKRRTPTSIKRETPHNTTNSDNNNGDQEDLGRECRSWRMRLMMPFGEEEEEEEEEEENVPSSAKKPQCQLGEDEQAAVSLMALSCSCVCLSRKKKKKVLK